MRFGGRFLETINVVVLKFCTHHHDKFPQRHGKMSVPMLKHEPVRPRCSEASEMEAICSAADSSGTHPELGGPFSKPSMPSLSFLDILFSDEYSYVHM